MPQLTPDMFPPKLTVLRFEPDCILKLSLPIPLYMMLWSFCLYAALASLSANFLINFVGPAWLFGAAFAVWIFNIKRGIVLTVDLRERRYRVCSPLGWGVRSGYPSATIKTVEEEEGRVASTLVIAGYEVLVCRSREKDAAERPFRSLLLALTLPQSDSPTAEPDKPKAVAPPLIVLVHGTWGSKSSWATPEHSEFVKAITSQLQVRAIFEKFPWSGANSAQVRFEAATRLAQYISGQLATSQRNVVMISHSHGGNIAMRAAALLTEVELRNVRNVFMNTPFLSTGAPFDIGVVHESLPDIIQSDLAQFCGYGFWFISVLLFSLVSSDGIPLDGSVEWWKLPLEIFVFFAPFAIFGWSWERIRRHLAELPRGNTVKPLPDQSLPLVIAHAQDEAFQALSFVVNLLSLAHHALLAAMVWVAWIFRKSRTLDVLFWTLAKGFSVVLILFLALHIGGGLIDGVVSSLFSVSKPPIRSALESLPEELRQFLSTLPQMMVVTFMLAVIVVGTVIATAMLIVLITALTRIIIFSGIGVIDQILTRSEFLIAVLGTVSISMIPPGRSESLRLEGRTLFNHSRIYEDPQVVALIAEYISKHSRPGNADK